MIKDDLKEKINSFISGELSEAEASEVRKLIDSSEEAGIYYKQNLELLNMMDSFESIEPDPAYIQKFWGKVEEEKSRAGFSFLNLFNLNKKWAFAGSFGVFVLIGSFMINSYFGNNGNGLYLNNLDDESLLSNLDESISARTPDSLNVYGPWDDLEN